VRKGETLCRQVADSNVMEYSRALSAAVTTPDTLWNFCPSEGAAYAFIVLFGLACATHVFQGIYHRKAYTWVISMVSDRGNCSRVITLPFR
jgi:hypothetical protein